MTRLSTLLCAQLAVSAVVLSMSGAANAQERVAAAPAGGFTLVSDIGCVDNTPAPPFTHSCPTVTQTSAALAAMPREKAHPRRKTTVQ